MSKQIIETIKFAKCNLFHTPASIEEVFAWKAKLTGGEALAASVAVGMLINFLADNLEVSSGSKSKSVKREMTEEQREKRRAYHAKRNAEKKAAKLKESEELIAETPMAELVAKQSKAKAKSKSKSK
jgi:hypothetical protein